MRLGNNPYRSSKRPVQRVNRYDISPSVDDGQIERLIEIAVVSNSPVIDADQRATHDILGGIGVEIIHEKFEVFFETAVGLQVLSKTPDRRIGNRKSLVKTTP